MRLVEGQGRQEVASPTTTDVTSEGREAAGPPSPRVANPAVKRVRPPLRVLGTSVTQIEAVKQTARDDLGLDLDFITLDGTEAQRRGALAPQSFDVYDQWFHDIDLIWPTGSIRPIEIARIDRWDEINDLPKTGRLGIGARRAAGGDPSRRLFVQLDGSLGDQPSSRVSMLPTVHNADSLAVVGEGGDGVTSWGALLEPEWAGRVVLQADAAIGSLDMLLALRARGEMDVNDLGDLSIEEIDDLVARLRSYRQAGHFRAFWADEAEAVAQMRAGESMIGSLWWSGVTRLRALGVPVHVSTPREGYRGWFGGLGLSARLDDWALDAAYDYLNWWLEGPAGALMARNGAYMSNPETVRPHLSENEWEFWYRGRAASDTIRDTEGRPIFQPGERREGGAYEKRLSRVVVWDTVMNEHNYLVRRWDHALGG